jgi:hypothetical protein
MLEVWSVAFLQEKQQQCYKNGVSKKKKKSCTEFHSLTSMALNPPSEADLFLSAQKCRVTERNIYKLLSLDTAASSIVSEIQHLDHCDGKYADLIQKYEREYEKYRSKNSELANWKDMERNTSTELYKVKSNIANHYRSYTKEVLLERNPDIRKEDMIEKYQPFGSAVLVALIPQIVAGVPLVVKSSYNILRYGTVPLP